MEAFNKAALKTV